MKLKLFLPLIIGSAAVTGMVYTFVSQASPYVTVAQAQRMDGNRLHLAGDMIKGTVSVAIHDRKVRFTLRDDEGDYIPVVYHGAPPANMGTATRVVVIGGVKEGVFIANDMLLKCPSKYESKNAVPQGASRPAPVSQSILEQGAQG